jgi:hypothetical protein
LGPTQDATDDLRGNLEFSGDFGSRMGSLTAQPEVQADHLFLPWAEGPEQGGDVIQIHAIQIAGYPGIRRRDVQTWAAIILRRLATRADLAMILLEKINCQTNRNVQMTLTTLLLPTSAGVLLLCASALLAAKFPDAVVDNSGRKGIATIGRLASKKSSWEKN